MPLSAAVSKDRFQKLMSAVGPFEDRPAVAVAVSGGADSMALTLLADRWARDLGGRAVGLTVDHGLRPESGEEAETVGRWLRARSIPHHTLSWTGEKPATGVQAAAREARHGLLEDWCRDAGVLHLLYAHHRDDQAETVLLRLERGSGAEGAAAMAPVVETAHVRRLRPLLPIPRSQLEATLGAEGQPWVEDPSNRKPEYARSRLRAVGPALDGAGLTAERLAGLANRMGRVRVALEAAAAEILGRGCRIEPWGAAALDPGVFARAPREAGVRAFGRAVACVGGLAYPPGRDGLDRAFRTAFENHRPTTVGRCLVRPEKGAVVVGREDRNLPPPTPIEAGKAIFWDGRFKVLWSGAEIADVRPWGPNALPGLWLHEEFQGAPNLGFQAEAPRPPGFMARFEPRIPMSGPGFCLAMGF